MLQRTKRLGITDKSAPACPEGTPGADRWRRLAGRGQSECIHNWSVFFFFFNTDKTLRSKMNGPAIQDEDAADEATRRLVELGAVRRGRDRSRWQKEHRQGSITTDITVYEYKEDRAEIET